MYFRLLDNTEVRVIIHREEDWPRNFYTTVPIVRFFESGGRFGRKSSERLSKAFVYFLAAKHPQWSNRLEVKGGKLYLGWYTTSAKVVEMLNKVRKELMNFYNFSTRS